MPSNFEQHLIEHKQMGLDDTISGIISDVADDSSYLYLDGSRRMTGDLVMSGHNINNVSVITTATINATTVNSDLGVIDELHTRIGTLLSTPYNLPSGISTVLANTVSTPIQINLPAASLNNGRIATFKKTDITSNLLTLDANASELIDGSSTITISGQYTSKILQCNGTNWSVISTNEPSRISRIETDITTLQARAVIPPGAVMDFAGSTAPTGWLICDGGTLKRTTYAALFAAIGTTWGAGDGSTTFNLPDARGKARIGAGTGSGLTARTLGTQNIGEESHLLTGPEIPAHAHTVGFVNDGSVVGGNLQSGTTGNTFDISPGGTVSTGDSGSFGGGQIHNNMQPSAVYNVIIKY